MKNILKYLIFFLIGYIIYNIVNQSQRFSIGVPVTDLLPDQKKALAEDMDGTDWRLVLVNGNAPFIVDEQPEGAIVIPTGTTVLLLSNTMYIRMILYRFVAINLNNEIVLGWTPAIFIPLVHLLPPAPPAPAPPAPAPPVIVHYGNSLGRCGTTG